MAEFYGFDGLMTAGTFKVDTTTASTVSADPNQLVCKAVTATGDGEVGYGSSSDRILGIVQTVEKESTNSDTLVVCVKFVGTFEDIPYTSAPSVGDAIAVDGNGGVTKSDSGKGQVLAVNSTDSTCTILL